MKFDPKKQVVFTREQILKILNGPKEGEKVIGGMSYEAMRLTELIEEEEE